MPSKKGATYHRLSRLYSDSDEPRFAVRLDLLLFENDINNRRFAKVLGTNPNQIGRWLLEEYPPPVDSVIKIAKYFDVTTDWLLGLSDNRK